MNWKLFGGFGILISVILALSLGLTLPNKNAEPDHEPETEGLRNIFFYSIIYKLYKSIIYLSNYNNNNNNTNNDHW